MASFSLQNVTGWHGPYHHHGQVAFDLLTLIVVCLNALDRPRSMEAKIATVLYRDGILYFVVSQESCICLTFRQPLKFSTFRKAILGSFPPQICLQITCLTYPGALLFLIQPSGLAFFCWSSSLLCVVHFSSVTLRVELSPSFSARGACWTSVRCCLFSETTITYEHVEIYLVLVRH